MSCRLKIRIFVLSGLFFLFHLDKSENLLYNKVVRTFVRYYLRIDIPIRKETL